ncbi:MAG: hypothetical protein ABJP79_08610 [Tateyamaria sp.]|uniref:hypothetical protein n=1 Tax=Tateyamaria sp. TaxID=1929288 RepID=UPI00329E2972
MKVILHIGAHRTGTTSLQAYMRRNADELGDLGVGFWGPKHTRKGLFSGIQPMQGQGLNAARRARGRIMLQLEKAAQNGVKTLLVSDENLMGSVRSNLRTGQLYPDVGARLARYICGFDGAVDKVVMSVRSLDRYWSSAIAFGVGRGHKLPTPRRRNAIAGDTRSWRDVIADVSCAAPKSKIEVIPFEVTAGRVDSLAAVCVEHGVPRDGAREWLNRAPDAADLCNLLIQRGDDAGDVPDVQERWNPFDPAACAAMRETYADDMHWLVAGANGLATLTEKLDPTRVRQTLPHGLRNRGQGHDKQERRVAHPR